MVLLQIDEILFFSRFTFWIIFAISLSSCSFPESIKICNNKNLSASKDHDFKPELFTLKMTRVQEWFFMEKVYALKFLITQAV